MHGARKKARLGQKELERIAGQLMNVDMDIIRHGIMKAPDADASVETLKLYHMKLILG